MKFTVNIKGTPSPKNSQLVKLELIFYKRHYPRVPKVLDITGPLKDWDQKNQCFDGRGSEIKAKNQKLLDLVTQYTGIAEGWNKEGVEWAPAQLSHYFDTKKRKRDVPLKVMSVPRYLDHLILQKQNTKRVKNGNTFTCSGTAALYQNLKNNLEKFTEQKYDRSFNSYYFPDINEQFLKDYVCFIKEKGAKNGNRGGLKTKMSCFYGTFYYAGKAGMPGADLDIFNCVEPEMRDLEEQPQTLPYWVIQKIEVLDRSLFTKTELMHIDFFLFCFYCGGIAPVDAAYLTEDNIVKRGNNPYITYERKKFPKRGFPPYTASAQRIVDKYKSKCYEKYLLPIFSQKHQTEKQRDCRMDNLRNELNQTLKKVQKIIGYEEEFTWYAARGTFITRMLDIGVKPEKVAEMAGNSVATIYKYYFKNTTPDELFDTVAAAI